LNTRHKQAPTPQPNPNNSTRRPNTVTGFPRHFKYTKAADGVEVCRNYNTGKACPNPCVFSHICGSTTAIAIATAVSVAGLRNATATSTSAT